MNGITIGGLGSGLDTGAIIQQLVSLERIPINLVEGQKEQEEAKLKAVNSLKSLVSKLQDQAQALATQDAFFAFQVSASQDGVASLAVDSSAVAGTHTLNVLALAQTDRWAFDGVADKSAQLGGGQVSFSVNGTDYAVDVDAGASSLEEIAAAIEEAAGEDVDASVVNVGTSADPSYQLVLASSASGEDARLTGLSSTVAGLAIDGTGADVDGVAQSANHITVGANAVAEVDGLLVERETNDLDGVLEGVSITLQGLTTGNPMTFSVEPDDAAVKEKLQTFVDAYNAVVGFINEQNEYSEEGGAGGVLFGDSFLRSVRSSIDQALFDVDIGAVAGDTAGFSTLGLIGIDKNNDGTLTIDDVTLSAKLAEDPAALADLFADSDGFDNGGVEPGSPGYDDDTTADSGLAALLDRAIDRMFGTFESADGTSYKGLFDSRTQSINDAIERFEKDIESKEYALELFEDNLVQRFAALEEVMAGLQAQGAALQNALLGLPS